MIYDIFLCRKCGWVNAGKTGAATFSCRQCGARNDVLKSVRLAAGVDSRDIQKVMARIKMERGSQSENLNCN